MDSLKTAFVLYTCIGGLIVAGVTLLPPSRPQYDIKELQARYAPREVANEVVLRDPLVRPGTGAKATQPSDKWLAPPQPITGSATTRAQRAPTQSGAPPSRQVEEAHSESGHPAVRMDLASNRIADYIVRDGKTSVEGLSLRIAMICELSEERSLCWDLDGRSDGYLADSMRKALERAGAKLDGGVYRWAVVEADKKLAQRGGTWLDPISDPDNALLRPDFSSAIPGLQSTQANVQIVPLSQAMRLQYSLPETTEEVSQPLEIGAQTRLFGGTLGLVAVDQNDEGWARTRLRLEINSPRMARAQWDVELVDQSGRVITAIDDEGRPAPSGSLELSRVSRRAEGAFTTLTIDSRVALDSIKSVRFKVTAATRIDFISIPDSP